jgi:hypothetical protein
MLLKRPFLKLPIRFNAEALATEVRALPSSAWVPHPTGFVGNEAVRLVSPGGEETDSTDGQMAATSHLRSSQYIREVMEEIGSVWGRSRLMGLAAGRQVPPHIDTHYYWRTHFRIHVPVITNPGVLFTCGEETVHMEAGDCWIFDSFRLHDVQNKGNAQRIHLVLDTVGGGQLPGLIRAAENGNAPPRLLQPGERAGDRLMFEKMNSPIVMSPWEVRCHVAFLTDAAEPHPRLAPVLKRLDDFSDLWAAAWAAFGTEATGRPLYEKLLRGVRTDLAALGGQEITLSNGALLYHMLEKLIFGMALAEAETLQLPPRSVARAR